MTNTKWIIALNEDSGRTFFVYRQTACGVEYLRNSSGKIKYFRSGKSAKAAVNAL